MKRVTLKMYGSEFTFMADDDEAKRLREAAESHHRDQFQRDEAYERYLALNSKVSEAAQASKLTIEDFRVDQLVALTSKVA